MKTLRALVLTLLVITLSGCITYRYEQAEALIPPGIEEPFIETRLAQINPPQVTEELPLIIFKALFIPLPEEPTITLLNGIASNITTSAYDVVALIGDKEALTYLEQIFCNLSYRLGERQLVVTSFNGDVDSEGEISLYSYPQTELSVALLEVSPGAYQRLLQGAELEELPQESSLTLPSGEGPTLLFASLGEPSSEDWFETIDGHPYRIQMVWPNSDAIREAGFFDTWRLTHYSALSDPGTTWEYLYAEDLIVRERIDYLYVKGIVPLESNTLSIAPNGGRYAIEATFIIP